MSVIVDFLSQITGRRKNMFPRPSISENTELIEKLCTAMAFAKEIVCCAVKNGDNNNLVIFTCIPLAAKFRYQRICCVLQTRKFYEFTDKQQFPIDHSVKMLVALTHKLGKLEIGLPIPDILAYDSTFENHIYCLYTIQEAVEGTTLLRQYLIMNLFLLQPQGPTQNSHLLVRHQLARQLAEFIAKKETQQFPGYGVLKNASDMPTDDPEVLAVRFVLAVARARIAGKLIATVPKIELFIGELVYARLLKTPSQDFGERVKARNMVTMWEHLSEKGFLKDQPSVLWHPDFHPRNIMVGRNASGPSLEGVIDWDSCMALPRIMTRGPSSFLWKDNSTTLSNLESDSIKEVFNEAIKVMLPGYLEDAYVYSTNGVIVRALAMYALFGVNCKHYYEFSYEELERVYESQFPGELDGDFTQWSIVAGKPTKAG